VGQLDQAVMKNDWGLAHELAHEAMGTANDLANTGAAASTLLTFGEQTRIEELRTRLESMASSMREAWLASRMSDDERIHATMRKFHEAFDKIEKRPAVNN
jgi:hypothetical protein